MSPRVFLTLDTILLTRYLKLLDEGTRTLHPGGLNSVLRDEMESRNKIIAALLAFFLGSLGVHAFYLGNNTLGLLMLIGTVIGGFVSIGLIPILVVVIAFIQGIRYLMTGSENFNRKYVKEKRWI